MHPEIVRLAQQELDEVTGGERLPDYSDKPRLPYISAVMKEVLRWKTPNPLGTASPYLFFSVRIALKRMFQGYHTD